MNDATKTIEITRVFNAPRELVFSLFTEEKHIKNWWGPFGYTCPNTKLDVRLNGQVWLDMEGPDGVVISNRGEFLEIDKPSRLVFVLRALVDSNGKPQLETINTFTFEDVGSKTKMHMVAVITKSNVAVADAIGGMHEGWNQSLDKLERIIKENV